MTSPINPGSRNNCQMCTDPSHTADQCPHNRSHSYIKYYKDNPTFQSPGISYIEYYRDNPTFQPSLQNLNPPQKAGPQSQQTNTEGFPLTHMPNNYFPFPNPPPTHQVNTTSASTLRITPPPAFMSSPQQPNYATWAPQAILTTFNLLFSIPAMVDTHPMMLEMHQRPLDPQVMLEHELRIIALEGWWDRKRKRDKDIEEKRVAEVWMRQEREAGREIGARIGGNLVWGGGKKSNEEDGEEGEEKETTREKMKRWEELQMSMSRKYGGGEEVKGWGPLPAVQRNAEQEVDDGDFDLNAWEEIGRAWARVKPWELP
ncbi:MAG: hypothetical protein Q9166_004581 [cf. Caloplaca sp. 2 TL-2023]